MATCGNSAYTGRISQTLEPKSCFIYPSHPQQTPNQGPTLRCCSVVWGKRVGQQTERRAIAYPTVRKGRGKGTGKLCSPPLVRSPSASAVGWVGGGGAGVGHSLGSGAGECAAGVYCGCGCGYGCGCCCCCGGGGGGGGLRWQALNCDTELDERN